MFPYIVMFAHFVISTVIIFFVYKALVSHEKIKSSSTQMVYSALTLTLPAFLITLIPVPAIDEAFRVPAIVGIIIGAVILFFFQKSYIKDDETNALLVFKTAAILMLIIILILAVSRLIL